MSQKLSIKIAGILIMVMVVIMTIFTFYFVKSRTESMESELLSKGRIEAMTGAKMMSRGSVTVAIRPTPPHRSCCSPRSRHPAPRR